MKRKPLQAGDIIRLFAPGRGQPVGPCTVAIDETGSGLIWFIAGEHGIRNQPQQQMHVASTRAVKLIRRGAPAQIAQEVRS